MAHLIKLELKKFGIARNIIFTFAAILFSILFSLRQTNYNKGLYSKCGHLQPLKFSCAFTSFPL